MFTPSKDLQDLQDVARKMQALVCQQFVRDFVAYLEDEYRYAMVRVDEAQRPSILAWLGQVGGYYAIHSERLNAHEHLYAASEAICDVFDWQQFAAALDKALNEKYHESNPARLIVKPTRLAEQNDPFDHEILSFTYSPLYGWGD